MQISRHAELINLLDIAMIPQLGETAVDDFAVELFKLLGYAHRNRVARTRVDLPLFICGEARHAKTDVCIVDRSQNDILLLVQEDKRLEYGVPIYARAQLVADAGAAFNQNNVHREAIGLLPLAEKVGHLRTFLRALGHAWHRHGWHIAHFLQNSHHPDSVDSYSPWNLPSRGNPRVLLLSTCSSSCAC